MTTYDCSGTAKCGKPCAKVDGRHPSDSTECLCSETTCAQCAQRPGWVSVICCECGKSFSVRQRRRDLARELFCDIECCRKRWNRTHITRNCEHCGKEFTRPQSVKQTRFCSWTCYSQHESPHAKSGTIGNFGQYVSNKAGLVHFDSRLELRRMKELDNDASVKTWRRSIVRIPWKDLAGKDRTYHPDFDIEYINGDFFVEEVKGYCDEASRLKIEAGREFCKTQNIGYRVLNDRDMADFEMANEMYENEYGTWTRPTFESAFMQMSRTFALRSTCVRLQVGAVFVDSTYTRVLCFGYNGGVAGDENQCESLLPGACGCVHAEVNAMMKAMEPLNDSYLFVTTAPCKACAKLLVSRGIKRVYYGRTYRDKSGILFLKKHGVQIVKWAEFVKLCDSAFLASQFDESVVKPQLPSCDLDD